MKIAHVLSIIMVIGVTTLMLSPAFATNKTVTLSVPTMSCPVCPITVKKALTKVPGVSKTDIDFEKRQATITFDDSKTSIDTITRATMDAGYPSTLKTNVK